jgi:hypothetical protein
MESVSDVCSKELAAMEFPIAEKEISKKHPQKSGMFMGVLWVTEAPWDARRKEQRLPKQKKQRKQFKIFSGSWTVKE